jgi:hypothetical protein
MRDDFMTPSLPWRRAITGSTSNHTISSVEAHADAIVVGAQVEL